MFIVTKLKVRSSSKLPLLELFLKVAGEAYNIIQVTGEAYIPNST